MANSLTRKQVRAVTEPAQKLDHAVEFTFETLPVKKRGSTFRSRVKLVHARMMTKDETYALGREIRQDRKARARAARENAAAIGRKETAA